jgi:hypothetical protein
MPFQIIVLGSVVPDPLQTLEPVGTPTGPALKNEMMLPAVLDPWAGHALYEAANLAARNPGSKVTLLSLGPKAKLQQVMMTVAQKVPFELIALDGPAGGFTDAHSTAAALAAAIKAIPALDPARLLVFGGWESASRGAGATLRFMTHLNQVGQTGATPRHPKGLSTCCHGEEPHVVGWRFITERRAINLDPNCGWARGKADVVYVADAFAVMSKVNALLAKKSAAVAGD